MGWLRSCSLKDDGIFRDFRAGETYRDGVFLIIWSTFLLLISFLRMFGGGWCLLWVGVLKLGFILGKLINNK